MEVAKRSYTELLLKMTTLNLKIKAYSHIFLNTPRKNSELTGCMLEGIKNNLKGQKISEVKRISIVEKKKKWSNYKNQHLKYFEKLSHRLKIGYMIMNINTYSTHFDDISIRNFRIMKHGAKEPSMQTVWSGCFWPCGIYMWKCELQWSFVDWKWEKEILKIKHTQGISFTEVWKIEEAIFPSWSYSTIKMPTPRMPKV